MRQIVNFFIVGLILWISTHAFPEYVQIDGGSTLILATLLFFVVTALVILGIVFVVIVVLDDLPTMAFVTLIVAMLLGGPIALTILSKYLNGFNVVGFWPKVLISFACAFFTISTKHQNQSD